jgi:hypothetical protein
VENTIVSTRPCTMGVERNFGEHLDGPVHNPPL